MAEPTDRRRVIYSGRVQGVGFRATTASIARRHPVAGYVKNLRDGTVEVVAEGRKPAVDAFLNQVESEFSAYIDDRRSEPLEGGESHRGFDVRF